MTPINNDKGFSLIEMLAAVTVLAVGLLALAGLQMTAIRTNSHAANLTEATALAQAAVERIQALDGDRDWLREEWVDSAPPADLADLVAGTPYRLLVNTAVDFNGIDNLTRINLTVESINAVQKVGGNARQAVTLTVLKRYF
ncbi:type IV pilus modification PilV family protein [Geoalkalibacter sp.]|uniref:type IV pilus modification PilV family protein n=1 Tax=Geoalkalibacter sp. TaxID=3041440 RepID=UPI00272E8352|nr:prepilin-type N-terminal cleavage/methylation domain-containing protein [Geoalkalibacter sp.]